MDKSSLIVRWVDCADSVPADLFRPPVEGLWWYRVLERSGLDDQFRFLHGLIERRGQVIGVVPTFLMDVPLDVIAPDRLAGVVRFVGKLIRPLRYQRTLFIGSPCSDEGTIGLIPGVTLSDVLPAVAAAVVEKSRSLGASMTVFKDFNRDDEAALDHLPGFFRVESFPGTRVTVDGYWKKLRSDRRNKLKKKLARGSAAFPTHAQVVTRPSPAVLDEIFPLFWQTYLKGKTKFERLNRHFFDLIAAQPTSHWLLLRSTADDRLVAFMLLFDCRPRAINKFIGIDYGVPDAFLYFRLWTAAVDWATTERFTELQSGQTGYQAKLEIGNELVPLVNFARHRNRLVHRLFAWQANSIDWSTIDPALASHVGKR